MNLDGNLLVTLDMMEVSSTLWKLDPIDTPLLEKDAGWSFSQIIEESSDFRPMTAAA